MNMTEEQKRLVDDNHGLIYSFLSKHNLSIDEQYGLAAIGLCKAGITYKGEKSKFSTYAYKCMFNEIFGELRKEQSTKRIPKNQIVYYEAEIEANDGDTVSFLNFIPNNEDVENDTLSKVLFDEYLQTLNKRNKQILILFSKGYKQKEISELVGCSQPQVSKIKKEFKEYLNG